MSCLLNVFLMCLKATSFRKCHQSRQSIRYLIFCYRSSGPRWYRSSSLVRTTEPQSSSYFSIVSYKFYHAMARGIVYFVQSLLFPWDSADPCQVFSVTCRRRGPTLSHTMSRKVPYDHPPYFLFNPRKTVVCEILERHLRSSAGTRTASFFGCGKYPHVPQLMYTEHYKNIVITKVRGPRYFF